MSKTEPILINTSANSADTTIGINNISFNSDETNLEIGNTNGDNNNYKNALRTAPNAMRQMSTIAEPVSMSWHNIDVFSKTSASCLPFKKNAKNKCVHILKNDSALSSVYLSLMFYLIVSGQVKPGQLLAIMGASGAGKTTLINVLTQRNLSNVDVKGAVKLNGKIANVNSIISLSAYVQQDDLFLGTLTVSEHLKFASQVRMEQHLSDKVKKQRVEQVLVELGLMKCKNTVIGWPGSVKGISGGEMKRLAFASELLTNPSIMFCDEPTSGLDAFMAQSVVEVLRDMAAMGRTIICTIHQPSSEVFAMFDQLCLMADGRVAYLGKLEQSLEYFASLELRCPTNYNPADYYIQELAVIPGKEIECRNKIKQICDHYISTTYAKESMPNEQVSRNEKLETSVLSSKRALYKANWFVQFKALTWRASLNTLREPMITAVRVVQTTIIALLLGFIYWRQDNDQQGVQNVNGALFLLITNMNFQNAFAVIQTFCIELPIFLREHHNGMYRVDTYFISKQMAELPTFIIVPALFVSIYYYMVGFNKDVDAFFLCLFIAVLVANCACSFGYFVSCIASNITMALSIGPPILIPMLIFGGFFLNNDSVPIYFIWFKYISWFYYGNEALMINQWRNVDRIDCPTLSINQTAPSSLCLENGKMVLEYLNFKESYFVRDILLLLALTIGLRVLAYIALLLKSRNR